MADSLRVTALTASAQLGGTERVLLDFAARAFEHDIRLRVLSPRDGPLIAILNQIGVPAEVVPAPAAMLHASQQPGRLWSAIPLAIALPVWARALRSHEFARESQLLYSVGFKTHLSTTFPMRKQVVWHLHEFPPQTTGMAWRWLAARIPNRLIANSQAVAQAWEGQAAQPKGAVPAKATDSPGTMASFQGPATRLTVVRNGVDLDRFKPRPRTGWMHQQLNLPRDARLVGMPAVFARWKGHEVVIEAFRSFAADFPNVHLVFVGGSIYDTVAEREFGKDLERLVTPDPTSRIHLLPFQPKIELAYPEFDLVVHYSLRPEPFGRVILEAMACGIPVLAANEAGPVEILGEDERSGGWLVPPRDAMSLAATLRRSLAMPPENLSRVGQSGRVRAEDHFSARSFARSVAEVLWSLD